MSISRVKVNFEDLNIVAFVEICSRPTKCA